MNPIFNRIFKLLPAQFRAQAIIAGGAAADLNNAQDIDVFILGINEAYKRENLISALRNAGILGLTFRDGDTDIDSTDSCPPESNNEVIADIDGGALLPVQIIASPFITASDLLADFDLSCHCVAYNMMGDKITIPQTTTLDQRIQVIDLKNPGITLARYRRMCLRYGLVPDTLAVQLLMATPDPELEPAI